MEDISSQRRVSARAHFDQDLELANDCRCWEARDKLLTRARSAKIALTGLRTVATLVFEPSLALVLESKPRGGLSIAHDEKTVVILKVLFEFVPYLARVFSAMTSHVESRQSQ
jgi:hypothetical protein